MAVVKNLMVRAGADFSAITKQADKAKAAMSGMQTVVTKSCSGMSSAVSGLKKVLGALGATLSVAAVVSFSKSAKEAYDTQVEGETKLAQVMRNTIGASNDEIKAIKDLTAAQQALGVIGDEVQLAGAQELTTYVTMTSTLETLIPVMNDMVAQQYGLSASGENAAGIATMLGKVLSGQTSALSRYGYTFTKAQEEILKYGTEAQRAATLAEVVEQSVGGMNAALAATPSGRLQQVSNTLGDIKEGFGQAVTSLLTTFLPALNLICSLLASMATLASKVAQAIANVFGGGGSSASTMVSYTGAATGAMDDLTDAAEGAGKAAEKLNTFGFDQITKLSDQSGGTAAAADADGGLSGGAISEMTAGSDETGETIGWLEKALSRLKETAASLNFEPLTGALERLKAATEPLSQTLFAGLKWAYDNVLEPLAHWAVESAAPAFLDMLATSAATCGPALEQLGQAVAPLVSAAFEGLKWAYDNVFIPLGTWVGGEFLPAFLDVLAEAADALSAGLDALQPLGIWLWDNFLQPIASWTGGVVVDVLNALADRLGKVGDWIKGHQAAVETIAIAIGTFAAAWAAVNIAIGIWNGICVIATAATGAFGTAVAILTSPITLVIAVIAALVAGVVLLVKNWDTVKAAGAAAWEGIKKAWNVAVSWFTNTVITPIKNAFTTVTTAIKDLFANAWSSVKGVWTSASSWFTSNIINPITNGFKGFANGIISFFEGLANGAIKGINTIVKALNKLSFDIPSWVPVIGGGKFGFSLSTVSEIKLPRLATGGVVDRPTPALIGEDGPEAVVPLSENAAWLDALAARITALTRSGNGAKLTIPIYVGGRKLTQVVIDDINEIINTTGEIPIHI